MLYSQVPDVPDASCYTFSALIPRTDVNLTSCVNRYPVPLKSSSEITVSRSNNNLFWTIRPPTAPCPINTVKARTMIKHALSKDTLTKLRTLTCHVKILITARNKIFSNNFE